MYTIKKKFNSFTAFLRNSIFLFCFKQWPLYDPSDENEFKKKKNMRKVSHIYTRISVLPTVLVLDKIIPSV